MHRFGMIFFATFALLLCIMCDALKVQQLSDEFLNKSILELEMRELLGIGQSAKRLKRQMPLKNSAAKFLLEVYNIVEEHETENVQQNSLWLSNKRSKRSIRGSEFLTELDVMEIAKCNTIITFPSKRKSTIFTLHLHLKKKKKEKFSLNHFCFIQHFLRQRTVTLISFLLQIESLTICN